MAFPQDIHCSTRFGAILGSCWKTWASISSWTNIQTNDSCLFGCSAFCPLEETGYTGEPINAHDDRRDIGCTCHHHAHASVGMETKLYAKEFVMKVLEADDTSRFLGRYPPPIQRRSTSLPRMDEREPPHPHPLWCHPVNSERQVRVGSYYDGRNVWQTQTSHPLRPNPTRSHSPMRFDSCRRQSHTKAERKKCNEDGMEQEEPKEGRKKRQAFAVLFEEPEFRNLHPGLATDYANEAEGWLWRTKTIWAGGSDQIGSRTSPSPEHPSPGGGLVQSFQPGFNQPPPDFNSQSNFSAFGSPFTINAPPPVVSRQPSFILSVLLSPCPEKRAQRR